MLIPIGTRCGPSCRNRSASACAPWLLNPIRLISAPLAGSRYRRGRGFPACGCQVTVPTSTCPKPNAAQPASAIPSLSIPAASPTGLGNRTPNTVRGAATENQRRTGASSSGTSQRTQGELVRGLGITVADAKQHGPDESLVDGVPHGLHAARPWPRLA